MFYMVMLGCAIAIRKNSHPALTFLTDWIRGVWRFALEIWVELVVLAAVVFMFLGGWEMMAGMAGRGRTASLRVRFSWIYLSIPLGCLLMGIAVIRRIAAEIVRTKPLDDRTGHRQ
jgi:TRAP-type C4-dicarboxylate transport system permease small subunit